MNLDKNIDIEKILTECMICGAVAAFIVFMNCVVGLIPYVFNP
jgi:hypothetical protein